MSANDQSARAKATRPAEDPVVDDTQRLSSANEAYYALLVERLEALLQDMDRSGTPVNDPLLVRLNDLLAETRRLLENAR